MSSDEIATLNTELEAARRRIAELEALVAVDVAAKGTPTWLYSTLDRADLGVWEWELGSDKVYWTEAVYRIYGYTRESFGGDSQAIFKATLEATLEEDRAHLMQSLQHTITTGVPYHIEYRVRRPDGEICWVQSRGQVAYDERDGKAVRLVGTVLDISDRKREEVERIEMQQRIIDAQRETLRALGAPVIPLAQKTLASPLIGTLDDDRIAQLTEVLLVAVRDASAEVVLLDITGVPHVDTGAAAGLIKTAQAVRLLGAELVLTGVRPAVARILVDLDVEFDTFVIKANLQAGIEYAASRRQGASS